MVGYGYNSYRRMDVLTADPKKLVIMCYETMIRNLKSAKEKYLANDFEGKSEAIQNTLDIMTELRSALDFQRGGIIAKNLDALYAFWGNYILKADRTRDFKALDDVTSMLEEIKSALDQAYYGGKDLSSASNLKEGPSAISERSLR